MNGRQQGLRDPAQLVQRPEKPLGVHLAAGEASM